MGRVPLVPVFLASCRIRQCSHPHRCAARVSACSPDRAFVDRERYGRNGLLRTCRSVAARPGAWETPARLSAIPAARSGRVPCWPSEVGHMIEMLQLFSVTSWFLLPISLLIFDIPRYTLSLLSFALFGVRRQSHNVRAGNASVSVIIPTFNGGSGLAPTIGSLRRQT